MRRKRKKRASARYQPGHYTEASAVTIKKADGTVTIEPAYTPSEFRKVAKLRSPIGPKLRRKIFNRDSGKCRYCHKKVGIVAGDWQVDHVVPVASGGPTTIGNLVTACTTCNQKKGAQTWKPKALVRKRATKTQNLR